MVNTKQCSFRQREYRKPCLNQNKMGGMGGGPGGAGGIGDRGRQGGMNPSWNGGGAGAGGGLGMGGMGGAGNAMGGRVYFSILQLEIVHPSGPLPSPQATLECNLRTTLAEASATQRGATSTMERELADKLIMTDKEWEVCT